MRRKKCTERLLRSVWLRVEVEVEVALPTQMITLLLFPFYSIIGHGIKQNRNSVKTAQSEWQREFFRAENWTGNFG